jgi:hypothetical protein
MLTALYDAVRRLGDGLASDAGRGASCARGIGASVEHVIDATYSRLRLVPGYARRLRAPVVTALRHIDALTESLQPAIDCGPAAFSDDPRINAFFVDPTSLRRLFSDSGDVRRFFASHAGTDACFAALCMHQTERRQLGMGIVNDSLRKDIMQTTVSFRDHRLLSPGHDEEQARAALKCWLFDALIDHARDTALTARGRHMDLEARGRALRARLRRLDKAPAADDADRGDLERQLCLIEGQMDGQGPVPATPREELTFIADTLSQAGELLTSRRFSLYLDRFGIKQADGAVDPAFEVPLYELSVGERRPHVISLLRFPRTELLPERDFLREVSRFLSGGGNIQ